MAAKKRIEHKVSRTAEYTCMCRASSFLDKDFQYKSNDDISVKLLPKFILFLIKYKLLNLKSSRSPKGIYEYVIGRTKYIDEIFQKALLNNFNQILFFGAGFDSRAIRFLKPGINTKVFELDAYITQEAKKKQLKKRGIKIPQNNIYVSIDFIKEDIYSKLFENEFLKGRKTLFILEGLTMYLDNKAVDSTFKFIYENAGPGSQVVFDYVYASVLRQENRYYGEKEIYKTVKKAGEDWTFGIEEGQIESFLNSKKLALIDHLDSNEIEQRYFKNEAGEIMAKVNGSHSIALGEIK